MDRRSFFRLLAAGLVAPALPPPVKYFFAPPGGWNRFSGPMRRAGEAALMVVYYERKFLENLKAAMPQLKLISPVIGQYADYARYDPDGIAGPPTPKDTRFERAFFGPFILDEGRQ